MEVLKIGNVVTFTSNNVTGDRSYTRNVWKVVAINDTHVCLEALEDRDPVANSIIVNRTEHTFSLAESFIHRVPCDCNIIFVLE